MLSFRLAPLILIPILLSGQVACWRNPPDDQAVEGGAVTSGEVSRDESTQAREYLEQGKAFFRSDEDLKALESFKNAIKLDPTLSEAHFRLALTQKALGAEESDQSFRKAIDLYKKYLVDNPEDVEARYNLGQAYAGIHLYSDAVREYRYATRLRPDDADIFYDLGLALSRLAQYSEAVAAFSKSLEIDPENYRAQDALDEAREGAKRIAAGRKHQEELLRKQKEKEQKEQEAASGEQTNKPKLTP